MKFFTSLVLTAVCVLALLIVVPYSVRAVRPHRQAFRVTKTFAQVARAESAFDIGCMTDKWVVSEGPCAGNGCNGGVLSEQFPVDVKAVIPNLQGYDGKTTSIIWLYQVKPLSVERRNDTLGDDVATINGIQTKDNKVYFAVVPASLVEPYLRWIEVNTQ